MVPYISKTVHPVPHVRGFPQSMMDVLFETDRVEFNYIVTREVAEALASKSHHVVRPDMLTPHYVHELTNFLLKNTETETTPQRSAYVCHQVPVGARGYLKHGVNLILTRYRATSWLARYFKPKWKELSTPTQTTHTTKKITRLCPHHCPQPLDLCWEPNSRLPHVRFLLGKEDIA